MLQISRSTHFQKFMRGILGILFVLGTILGYPATAWALRDAPRPPLSYSNAQLSHRNFSGEALVTAEFANANLEFANFANADLRGAVMSSANLKKANLTGANLSSAMMDQTDLRGADLSEAILNETLLFRAIFTDLKMMGTDFTDALLDKAQIAQLCLTASGINSKTGVVTRESLGCDPESR